MKRRRLTVLPLMKFITSISPRFREPTHLTPFVQLLEMADTQSVKAVCSVPPRHFKTETVKHAIVRMLLRDPSLRIIYAGYSQTYSEKKSREIRELARRAGVPISDDASSRKDWRTGVGDGGLWATSIGGPITGEGADVLIIDDPVKDRATAESAIERAKLWDWCREVAFTRLEPPHGSCFLIQTRWHADDPAGQLERQGWISVSLPAIDAQGRALDPKRFPIEKLREIEAEIGAYGWASLYMQRPRLRGGEVFTDVHYAEPPDDALKIMIGIDCAYSTKTHADYSVAVVIGAHEGTFYVLEVIRGQWQAPDLIRRLRGLRDRYGAGKPRWYTGGQEGGLADVMKSLGLDVDARPAKGDKFVRAQPVAAAWNAGKIKLPRSAPWVDAFVSEIVSFTGTGGDVHDDQVDALAAAYDAIARIGRRGGGGPYGGAIWGQYPGLEDRPIGEPTGRSF